jgi:uncharacterized RDD family membrane protein YckC
MRDHLYGGFWRRTMAFFIDKTILFFISMIVLCVGILALWIGGPSGYGGIFMDGPAEATASFMLIYFSVGLMMHMLYFTYFHGTTGQTPGKMIFGLQVVQSTGEQMTTGLAFLRWTGYFVSTLFLYLGFLWIAIDKRKQGWHDKIAGTVVIRTANIVDGPPLSSEEKYLDKGREI